MCLELLYAANDILAVRTVASVTLVEVTMKEDHTLDLKVLGEVKANMISKTPTSIVDMYSVPSVLWSWSSLLKAAKLAGYCVL